MDVALDQEPERDSFSTENLGNHNRQLTSRTNGVGHGVLMRTRWHSPSGRAMGRPLATDQHRSIMKTCQNVAILSLCSKALRGGVIGMGVLSGLRAESMEPEEGSRGRS